MRDKPVKSLRPSSRWQQNFPHTVQNGTKRDELQILTKTNHAVSTTYNDTLSSRPILYRTIAGNETHSNETERELSPASPLPRGEGHGEGQTGAAFRIANCMAVPFLCHFSRESQTRRHESKPDKTGRLTNFPETSHALPTTYDDTASRRPVFALPVVWSLELLWCLGFGIWGFLSPRTRGL